jgi:OmpA-OmpF porin, OOP family
MSFNLIDAAKGIFTNELVNKASSYLGESENSVAKAMSGILPSVIGGIADKSASTEGANAIASMAGEHHSSGILGSIGSFFGNEGGGLLNKGAGLLGSLFGDTKMGMLTSLISSFSGIKSTSATSLLSMAAPAVMGFLGKHAADNKLNAGGLASMLSSQKDNISAALPGGLNLGSIFNSFSGTAGNVAGSAKAAAGAAASYADDAVEKTGSAMKWLLPLLLLALAAAAVLYFWKGCGKTDAAASHDATTHADSGMAKKEDAGAAGTTTTKAGTVDSSGNFVYDLGEMVTLDLPNNGGQLKVGKNSTEAKLVGFLNDKNAMIDTTKGNWYEFTNVRFKTGSSDLTEESMTQLKNMVAIAKAYPTAVFKFGGYTDNVGAAANNVTLSQKRADAVLAMVKKLGAADASVKGGAKGYGPEHPIGDNNTAEGKAQNRRVAVNVKAK